MVRFNANVPNKLYADLKRAANHRGLTLTDWLIENAFNEVRGHKYGIAMGKSLFEHQGEAKAENRARINKLIGSPKPYDIEELRNAKK